MNNEQLTMNNEIIRNKKVVIYHLSFFFVLFSFFFCAACANPFEPPLTEKASGVGYFSLSIDGASMGRTIMPEIVQSEYSMYFKAYTLDFFTADTKRLAFPRIERVYENLSDPVTLSSGTWDLYVSAYLDVEKTKPAAAVELKGIIITSGAITTQTILLEPIANGIGTGTFSWDIAYPESVAKAIMTITSLPLNPGSQIRVISLSDEESKTGSITLPTGYYRVAFKLQKDDGMGTERWETLHVYQNMESAFSFTFTESHFRYNMVELEDFGSEADIEETFYVSTTTEWDAAVSSITGGGNNKNYIINITDNFSVAGSTANTFGNVSGIKVSLRGASRTLTLSNNGNMLRIGNNQTVVLRDLTLRGHDSNNNSLVYLSSTTATFTMQGGLISGNRASNGSSGGGVCVNGGTFTMQGGEISGNRASGSSGSNYSNGGGVYVASGTFTMNGGKISGNSSSSSGGGVFFQSGIFMMNGGEISGNSSPSYGGGVNVQYGTFTMNGGEISDNTDNSGGGGVYVRFGTFTMNGGEISNNTESSGGGGVYVSDINATFTMNGGVISGNTASGTSYYSYGGGVYVASGTFTMNGGEISGNTASSSSNSYSPGGGVYMSGGTFRIVTGTIYGSDEDDTNLRNTATNGAALYRNSGTAQFGTFIDGTWNSNGILDTSDDTIRVVDGVLFNITPMPDNHVFNVATTAEWNGALASIATYGINDNYIINVTADFSVAGQTTPSFGIVSGITVTIQGAGRTITLSGNGNMLRIGSNQTVELQDVTLQGHSSNNTSLVYVSSNGTFTMNSGEISGNRSSVSSYGGGVYVSSSGTFTMNSGEISGNTASSVGGGVYVVDYTGTFTMNGGVISGNTSSSGGGVHVNYGTFTMNGGVISGNTASGRGGGVYVYGTFTMNGGEISGNTSSGVAFSSGGGGVFVAGGTFTMNGGEISGNTYSGNASSSGGGGVYVYDSGTFTMNGGEISGNRATSSYGGGGGVYVNSGTFRIVTGTIYGSDEDDTSLRNIATNGVALYRSSGTTEFGTFSGDTWNSNGILDTSNDTIRVVDGVLLGVTSVPNNRIFNVATTAEWNSALSSIAAYGSNENYVINVTANFSVAGRTTPSFGSASGITVTIQGAGRILTLSGNGNMLRIGSNQTVELQNVTLRGHSSNNESLVYIGGTFTMNGGKISGNRSSSSSGGGGVYVNDYGTFTMNGGEISGNSSSNGGGVYVRYNGTFTMSGGEISGNTSSSYGGGVYMYYGTFTMNGGEISGNSSSNGGGVFVSSGTFTMNGGEISGNSSFSGGGVYVSSGTFRIVTGTVYGSDEADTSLKNTANDGAALYRISGTTQFGTFSGETWNGNGRLGTSDETIRVVDGVLIGATPMPDNHLFNVASAAEWNGALRSIAAYGSDEHYIINVTANFSVTSRTTDSFGISGITVTIQGAGRTITLSGNGNLLRIGNEQTVELQNVTLRGHSSNNDSLVYVSGGTFTMNGGAISGNTASGSTSSYGGGVYMQQGTFTMNGGEISGNSSSNGGGVYMQQGTFTMNGGEIFGNSSSNGGGVYVGYNGTFTMSGGEISGNTSSSYGGGGVYMGGGTFTMNGGEISSNNASSSGGGVYVAGTNNTFTMNGGTISGNASSGSYGSYGGGVDVLGGTFTMNGGEISGNASSGSSSSYGGGVYVSSGTFTMNGGEISGNRASGSDSNGGGVYVSGGTFTMNSGEISGNTASSSSNSYSSGGGVYVSSGTFRIVTGTVYGSDEADTSLRNTATNGAALYRISGTTQFGTFNGETWNGNGNLGASDDTIRVVDGVLLGVTPMPDNHLFNVASAAEWNGALRSIAAYGSNKDCIINVTANFSVAGRTTPSFGSASGITVTIQGTGRILTLSDNGNMLRIGSDQNVELQNVTLRGHSSNNNSLVYVSPGGTFTMNSGEISGNTASIGGGVYMQQGTFTMNGGKISGNTSSFGGGGVYMQQGTFTMNGGEISGNTSSSSGGGVYVSSGTFFTMNGGEISGNTASYGGGVYVSSGTFTMNGGEISGNTASYGGGGGVYVSGGTFRIVTGTIYGSGEADTSLRNTANDGAALYNNGTAQRGTFNGETWNSKGDLSTTNNTIKVVNGNQI